MAHSIDRIALVSNGVWKLVDVLLYGFEAGEVQRIQNARARHRDAQAAIHRDIEKLDTRHLHGLTFGFGEAVALIVRLRGIDGINLSTKLVIAVVLD